MQAMNPNTDIDALKISAYVRQLELDNQHLTQQVQMLKEQIIDIRKFESTTMTVEALARMHNVDPRTVRQYIHEGFIPTHPDSTDRKILIRSADAIRLDFRAFRRNLYDLKHN
jgi:hypothetical protein